MRSHSLAFAKKYPVTTKVFQSNATESKEIFNNIRANSVDIVFTDVPYGQHSAWEGSEVIDPIATMLDVLTNILSGSSIVAIASDKQQKVSHEKYHRIEQFQIGKRRVVIMKLI